MITAGILLAIMSLVCWGISDVTIKTLTERFDPISTAFYKGVPHIIFMTIFFVLAGFSLPAGKVWGILLLYGIIGFAAYYMFIKSISKGLVSLNVAIAHAYIIITASLSAVFFHERLVFWQYAAIGLIISGVFLITFDIDQIRKMRFRYIKAGAAYALGTALLWGVVFFIMKQIITDIGPSAAAFYQDFLLTVFIAAYYFMSLMKRDNIDDIKKTLFRRNTMVLIIGSGLASFLATVTMVYSVSTEMLSVSMGIISAAPFVTFLLAITFLKEKVNKTQVFAILTITTGIVLLSYIG